MFSLFTLCAICAIIYYKYRIPPRWKKYGELIPGPKAYPLIGNAMMFSVYEEILPNMLNAAKEFGPVYRFWLGGELFICISDPVDAEAIFTSMKHIEKGSLYEFLHPWLGNGLLTSSRAIWHPQRKLLTPAFHFKLLEKTIAIINHQSKILVDCLEKAVIGNDSSGTKEIDVQPFIEKCSLDIVGEASMGLPINSQSTNNSSYLDAVKTVTYVTVLRCTKLWLRLDFLFRLSPFYKPYQEALRLMRTTGQKIIERRRSELSESNEQSLFKDDTNSAAWENDAKKKGAPFLDILLSKHGLSDKQIQDELQTFLFAGHDTVTSAICSCIYQLSKRPEIQERIFEEVTTELGDIDYLTGADINKLAYLDNVVKESLRMVSPVPMITRSLEEDLILPSGYTLPAGSIATLLIQGIHMNPRVMTDPEVFNPNRFSDPDYKIPTFGFVPFSAGARNCIGQKHAMLELKTIIAAIVRNFYILPSVEKPELRFVLDLIQRSLDGVPVTLKRRSTKS